MLFGHFPHFQWRKICTTSHGTSPIFLVAFLCFLIYFYASAARYFSKFILFNPNLFCFFVKYLEPPVDYIFVLYEKFVYKGSLLLFRRWIAIVFLLVWLIDLWNWNILNWTRKIRNCCLRGSSILLIGILCYCRRFFYLQDICILLRCVTLAKIKSHLELWNAGNPPSLFGILCHCFCVCNSLHVVFICF